MPFVTFISHKVHNTNSVHFISRGFRCTTLETIYHTRRDFVYEIMCIYVSSELQGNHKYAQSGTGAGDNRVTREN